jgi:cell wall-associated NlpC family hydrolase
LRGTPYRFGGSTPAQGFDCSGLVAYVMAEQSIVMPRSVASQFSAGEPVEWERLQRGDLIFFSTTGPGATHVGIVTDTDRVEFVHAPADGAAVRVERFDAPYWRGRFVGARRIF